MFEDSYAETIREMANSKDDAVVTYCMSEEMANFACNRIMQANDEYNEFISMLPEFELSEEDLEYNFD